MHKWLGLAVSLAACATTRKGYTPGDDHATASSTSGAEPTASRPAAAELAYAKLPPYPAAPADPWRGVVGDLPRRWSEDRAAHWTIRGDAFDCSAAHDHCIDPDAWFVGKSADIESHLPAPVAWEVFGADGKPATAANARHFEVGTDNEWRAFRTVPATKANIARGAGVITLERGAAKPTSGVASHDATWVYGLVDEVDLDGGTFTFTNTDGAYPLWAARVVVLTWDPAGKVKVVGDKPRGALGVKASETYAPP